MPDSLTKIGICCNCINYVTSLLVECCFTSTETIGLLKTGAQDGHLDFHTALSSVSLK